MRKFAFANGEYYHVYNRGVDKRDVVIDGDDVTRFLQSMSEFNTLEPIGSIYERIIARKRKNFGSLASKGRQGKLVELVCYCLNQNHYHFILQQLADQGIEKFMHRLGTGYTKYFNLKHGRSGSLFQGNFKAIRVDSNEYLLRLSAYVNLNHLVHRSDRSPAGAVQSVSSWPEYRNWGQGSSALCNRRIICEQFRNAEEYALFARETLESIRAWRGVPGELQNLLLE